MVASALRGPVGLAVVIVVVQFCLHLQLCHWPYEALPCREIVQAYMTVSCTIKHGSRTHSNSSRHLSSDHCFVRCGEMCSSNLCAAIRLLKTGGHLALVCYASFKPSSKSWFMHPEH
jgi:hypothetical protein